MKTFLFKSLLFFAGSLLLLQCANAQKKLLILGSSTSTCFFGPSSVDSCYITRLQRYYQSIGSPITLDNRAVAGDNVYQGMPLSYTPPSGRNIPRPYNNITEGLAGNPDVVLINYPSNGYDIFTVEEVMNCFRTIKQTANNAGKPCYITTSQPRNDPESYKTQEVRNKMAEIKNRILSEFGSYAINFWDGIANPDNSLQYIYQIDGIHINDAGHRIFFNRVLEKNIFSTTASSIPPPTPTPPSNTGSGLTYKYYEGDWNMLPDFRSLQPVKSGSVSNIDMSARNRSDYYAFLWEGYINIPTAGNYTFEIISDDGSKLYFNTPYSSSANALVSNDGLHLAQSASNSVNINVAGSYPISISFFEKNGSDQMQVYWSGPGFSRQLIPNEAFTGQPGSGLTYKYYEGDWNSLPDFTALQPVKSGSITNVDISPRNRTDYYAFLWQGSITIPSSGNYTFELVSDDGSKLYFNSSYSAGAAAFVSNDGLHLAQSASNSMYINAGSYPIAITFFEKNGGEQMQVYWSGPGIPRQLIPNAAFSSQSNSTSGLKYKYFEGDWNTLPDFNALQPVKSGSIANVDISPRNRTDYYGFLWEGYINIPTAGDYNFETISDDGSKLYFNSQYNANANALVSNNGLHPTKSASANIYINAPGIYPIAITFFEKNGGEQMQVYWTGPGISRQPIPNEAFTSSPSFSDIVAVNDQSGLLAGALSNGANKFINAYPNPFNQTLNIAYYNNSTGNNISAGLYDLSGKLIHKENFKNLPAGASTLKINVKNRPSIADGIYFLKIDVNGVPFKVLKLVKSKS
jgi:predicted nucleic acid binding AN1-type Zn finger protein/lysophospholipase L1-like esterase